MKLIQRLIFFILLLFIAFSCANIGRPNGGPIDVTPPYLVKSTPSQDQTYFKKKKIEVEFDEIVLVESPSEKVTISPPQTNPPEISTSGKKIIVELKDSLRSNTTYTVDFSDAIVDNNEKNPFNNFSLAFSTGGYVDSLEVSGVLLNASDLEPITGMYVGVHKLLDDSAFTKKPFDRATRSDIFGRFTLKNVAAGRCRIYALKDANRDYKFDQSGEDIAFSDSIVVPTFSYVNAADTLRHKLKGTKDSIRTIQKKIFSPNQLLLRGFNENFKSQYLDKSERKQRNRLTINFAAAAASLPKIRPLNFPAKNWAKIERSATNDTLSYWIKDSTIYKQDTLLLEATYLHTDSLKRLIPQTDTLRFVFHDPKISAKKKKKDDKTKVVIPALNVDARFGSILDVYEDMIFTMQTPLDSVLLRKIRFEEKNDTTWKTLKLPPLVMDSLNIRRYTMHYKWLPGKEYRLKVDSATFYGIDGLCNKEIKKTFKIKDLEQYSGLFIKIVGITGDAFVELLNENDKPVRTEPVIKGVAEFYYLNPGTYYARLVADRNGNYKWDTGNYAKKLQPEEVFYYDGTLELRPNWDVEQEWNVRTKPIERQKPLKLVKNKPKEKTPIGGTKVEKGGR